MGMNTDSLYRPLKAVKDDLLKVIDQLDALSAAATSFGGSIGNTVPTNVNSLISKVTDIVSGAGNDSVDSLIEFLDNIPLGEIRAKTASERQADGQGLSRGARQPEIDTTPHTEGGPMTSVVHESQDISEMSLHDFYKANYGKKKRMHEDADPFSWDAILDSDAMADTLDMDIGNIAYSDEDYIGDTPFHPTDYVPDLEMENEEFYEDPDYEYEDEDEMMYESNRGQTAMRESVDLRDWKNVGYGDVKIDFAGLDAPLSDGLNMVNN